MKVTIEKTIHEEVTIPDTKILDLAIQIILKANNMPEGVYVGDNNLLMYEEECHTSHSFYRTCTLRKIERTDLEALSAMKYLNSIKGEV